jgi:CRP/FNR family transcriptional regulator
MARTEETIREAARVFAQVPSFTGLDTAALEAIARVAMCQTYTANQVVFLEGEPSSGLYVVQYGWLKAIKVSAAGREQILRVVGPDEVFNDISVLAGVPNMATVVALEAATVWNIPRDALLQLLDSRTSLGRVVIQNLAERILYLLTLIEDLSLRTIESRLARFLLEQATTTGVVPRRRWNTQAELAARLATVPDVLNRVLRSLVEAELIQVERYQIRILDRRSLEAKAQLN